MEVYVESQSQFHPRQLDRCRVEVGKTETRRPKWSCAAHGCACGYPVARTDWTVSGHPELTAEATRTLTVTSSSESCKKQDTKHMEEEKFKLRVATLADTEEQEVILGATGHFAAAEVRR